jgi:hypothetical protein
LEKLIAKAIAEKKESLQDELVEERSENFEDENINSIAEVDSKAEELSFEYNRSNLDEARNSFELEMKLRQESERNKLEENIPSFETPVFTQPEITFPELNVSFGNEKQEVEKDILDNPDLPEIKQEEELKTEFVTPKFNSESYDMAEPVSNFTNKKEVVKEELETTYFEPENEGLTSEEMESDFSFSQDGKDIPAFEETLKQSEEKTSKEDILRKIIEDNKAALERAKEKSNKGSNNYKQKPKSTKTGGNVSDNADTVTLQQSNTAKIIGIVAIGAAILPFAFIAIFAGVYGYNTSKKYKDSIDQNPQLYGSTITNNVNLGLYLSIAGAVIGGIRFISFIF